MNFNEKNVFKMVQFCLNELIKLEMKIRMIS